MYLGQDRDRWNPATERDVVDGLTSGLLEESHYLDFKASLGTSSGANKELARDLAQFAIDSGALVIGVAEADGKFEASPVPTAGLPERIEQVARTLIDPPLEVRCQVVPQASDSSLGYVVVHVPASGRAPHMVDGIYYGRGDKTRTRLSDAEVVRLHDLLRVKQDDAEAHLQWLIDRDPIPVDARTQAHLLVFAKPISPRREMALALVHGPEWMQRFNEVLRSVQSFAPFRKRSFAPDIGYATSPARRPDGAAMTSHGLAADRSLDPAEGSTIDLFEVEISEDGEIRLFSGRLSDELRSEGGQQVIFDEMPVALVRQVIMMASHVAAVIGYRGQWLLGVAAVGIEGLRPYDDGASFFRGSAQGYSIGQGDYRSTAVASTEELESAPGALTRRLVGRLLRALGRPDSKYADLMADEDPDSP